MKRTVMIALIATISLLFVCGAFFGVRNAVLKNRYDAACALLEDGSYSEAIGAFDMISFYKDSAEKAEAAEQMLAEEIRLAELEVRYLEAQESLGAGDYLKAAEIFGELDSYKNSADMLKEAYYLHAKVLYADGDYDGALSQLGAIKDYKDASVLMEEIIKNQLSYLSACELFDAKDYLKAAEILEELGDYKNSLDMLREAYYLLAKQLCADGDHEGAVTYFEAAKDYKDASVLIEGIKKQQSYLAAERSLAEGDDFKAIELFKASGDYADAKTRAEEIQEKIYQDAELLLAEEDYFNAFSAFIGLGDYADCKARAEEIQENCYQKAIDFLFYDIYDYDANVEAFRIFEKLDGYKESDRYAAQLKEEMYSFLSIDLKDSYSFELAYAYLEFLGNYKDCSSIKANMPERIYNSAIRYFNEEDYTRAAQCFLLIPGYKGDEEKRCEACYRYALELASRTDNYYAFEAYNILLELGDYKDSRDQAAKLYAFEEKYQQGIKLVEDGAFSNAVDIFEELNSYRDSKLKRADAAYVYATELLEAEDYEKAYDFAKIADRTVSYEGPTDELLDDILYAWGTALYEDGKLLDAAEKLMDYYAGTKSTTLGIQIMSSPEYWKLDEASVIYFGEYISYVHNETEILTQKLSWDVFRRDGNKLWLITTDVIDCRAFGGNSWESCELRAWLNGEFYNTWFSENEKRYMTEMDRGDGVVDIITLLKPNEIGVEINTYPGYTGYAMQQKCPMGSVSWTSIVPNWFLMNGYGALNNKQWWPNAGPGSSCGIRPVICITVE